MEKRAESLKRYADGYRYQRRMSERCCSINDLMMRNAMMLGVRSEYDTVSFRLGWIGLVSKRGQREGNQERTRLGVTRLGGRERPGMSGLDGSNNWGVSKSLRVMEGETFPGTWPRRRKEGRLKRYRYVDNALIIPRSGPVCCSFLVLFEGYQRRFSNSNV